MKIEVEPREWTRFADLKPGEIFSHARRESSINQHPANYVVYYYVSLGDNGAMPLAGQCIEARTVHLRSDEKVVRADNVRLSFKS
ncbi:hypothetical protein BcepF1.034 [Burkholderia phage BcepF1]|uniref:Uncharacterized protein n=1 Tax=Burkholderia phage BcepF1 TaxID=2886897 RepID=A1YZT8_9CAUD|nr:hypothetical protein BcepF1.034 [Burkholderia phage BcepF1]ABL96765.1 hypothetical protein BcepF1.034 [Burkholderia phage BcepF1]